MAAAVATRGGGGAPRGGRGRGRGGGPGGFGRSQQGGGGGSRMDETEYQTRMAVEQKQIEALRQEVDDLNKEIDSKNTGKEEFQRRKDELWGKISDLQQRIQELEDERNRVTEEINKKKAEGQKIVNQAAEMRKKLGYSTPEAIDQRVAELDYELHAGSMDLKKEKAILEEIKRLKRSRPQLAKYSSANIQKGVSQADDSVGLMERRNAIMTQLNAVRDQRKVQQDAYRKLIDERKGQTEHLQGYYDRRQELRAKIDGHQKARDQIREELFAKRRELQAKMAKDREARQAQRDLEQKKYLLREERRNLQNELEKEDLAPFEPEIAKTEHAIQFVKGMMEKENNKANEQNIQNGEKKEDGEVDIKLPPGCTAVLPTKKKTTGFWAEPTKKTKQSNGQKQPQNAAQQQAAKKKGVKVDIGVFSAFDEIGVKAPVTADDAPQALKELEAKLQEFKNKQDDATSTKKDRRSEINKELENLEKREAELKAEEEELEKKRKEAAAAAAAGEAADGGAAEAES